MYSKSIKTGMLASATVLATAVSSALFAAPSEEAATRYIIKIKNAPQTMSGSAMAPSAMVLNKAAELGIEIKSNFESINLLSVEMTPEALREIKKDANIEYVEIDQPRHLMALYNDDAGDPTTTQLTPYAVYQSQANQLTLQSGQKVCVIDSGIAGSNGETGGKNNDFDWNSITGTNDSGTGNWNADGGPHGTHVAGTVGAADNGFGVIGMAPGVPMHIIKVFNNAGWGYSSDLAFAAQKCTDAGANIITMSLGGGGSNTTENNAFTAFTNNGGLVLAAAGNDGNNVRSYPAGYDSVMMIGANDNDNNIATFSQYPSCNTNKTNCVEVTAGGVDTFSTYPSGGATLAGLSADGNGFASSAMENTGSASGNAFYMGTAEATNSGANGKICIIDRGNISFHDKVLNCENSGGIGAVIVNNVAGMLAGTLGTSNQTTIPAVGAAFEDKAALTSASTASITVGAGDYGMMSGTSMATPAVAGISALVWSQHPDCTGTDIRNALKATAEDSGTSGHDVKFGNGIVKAKAANDWIAANLACASSGTNPIDNAPVANFTSNCTDLVCSFNGTSSTDDNGIASYAWNFGDGSTGTGSTANHTYSADGTYSVSLTVTDTANQTHVKTSSVTVSGAVVEPPVGDDVLENGVAKTNLSGAQGEELRFTIEVPAGATDIAFNMNGGSGDADMYVKLGSAPSTSSYDCRPYKSGNTESCTGTGSGTYHVMLRGYSAFSGVSLTASYTESNGGGGAVGGGSTIENISVSRRAWKHYTLDVPAGMSALDVDISGGSGDADLYVRFGAQPTTSSYDCRPYKNGNNEACNFTNPAAGTWHISIRGYSSASGITLNAYFKP
jgi:serine protease